MVIKPGSTSVSFRIQITTDAGLPVTGLVAATFPALSYIRDKEAIVAITPLTDLTLITSAFTANGVKEYGNGYYRVDVPNAAWTTASNVILSGETTDKRVIAEPVEVKDLAIEIADAVLIRSVTNVEAGSAQYSLASVILGMFKNSISGTVLTIYRTDGTTVQFTETLTLNAAADPITGVS